MMDENLNKLYDYLINNGYKDDANRIKDIQSDLVSSEKEMAVKRLVAMCNPRYLGNLVIKEFEDVYQWWNFLGKIAEEAKKSK